MDVDQFITEKTNLRDLWEVDLQGKPLGMIEHCGYIEKNISTYWTEYMTRHKLDYYFGGLAVVDLDQMRQYGYAEYLRKAYSYLFNLDKFENLQQMD